MIKYLKEEKLENLVQDGTHIVDFYADWCGPCKMLGSVLESMEDVSIIKVNVDEHPELATKFGVMSIPTIIIFKNGVETKKQIGFVNADTLRELLK
ncbi:MAG: thioredoxin [Bacilli bacterium]|jgi:thioredoxin 1|nr:thioredoxin [Bacilli bacterium]